MALSISQAQDINWALHYLLKIPAHYGLDSGRARQAAGRLADHARKTLMAGLDAAEVDAAWPSTEDGGDDA